MKERVRLLITAVGHFSTQITHPEANPRTTSNLTHKLHRIKELLSESLYLFDLCTYQNVELHEDDGAINVVYASIFLVGSPHQVEISETIYDKVKKHQLANELTKVVSPLFSPHATSRNYQWGLQSAPPPSLIDIEL